VGQEHVLRLLHAVLRKPAFRTRGYIFDGPYAVGKTSVAYLFAKALMCLGDDPLGCGKCPSCKTELSIHPDFMEVDAATCSGVAAARELMSNTDNPATLGKCHVVIMDEAHRLSPEAWDVFLKPLESGDCSITFLFVTSEGDKIPATIQSRATLARFSEVPVDALIGMLMKIADREGIRYTQDGLRTVAVHAKGRPRDAIRDLGLAAACGDVNLENSRDILERDSATTALTIFQMLLKDDFTAAVAIAGELVLRLGFFKLIETLFMAFSRDVFNEQVISSHFAPLKEITQLFIKWSNIGPLSPELHPTFILELNDLRKDKYNPVIQSDTGSGTKPGLRTPTGGDVVMKGTAVPRILTVEEIKRRMEE